MREREGGRGREEGEGKRRERRLIKPSDELHSLGMKYKTEK